MKSGTSSNHRSGRIVVWLVVGLALFCAAIEPAVADQGDRAAVRRHVVEMDKRAREFYEAGELRKAIDTWLQLVREVPRAFVRPVIFYSLALAYDGLGETQDAVCNLRVFLRVSPTGPYSNEARKLERELTGRLTAVNCGWEGSSEADEGKEIVEQAGVTEENVGAEKDSAGGSFVLVERPLALAPGSTELRAALVLLPTTGGYLRGFDARAGHRVSAFELFLGGSMRSGDFPLGRPIFDPDYVNSLHVGAAMAPKPGLLAGFEAGVFAPFARPQVWRYRGTLGMKKRLHRRVAVDLRWNFDVLNYRYEEAIDARWRVDGAMEIVGRVQCQLGRAIALEARAQLYEVLTGATCERAEAAAEETSECFGSARGELGAQLVIAPRRGLELLFDYSHLAVAGDWGSRFLVGSRWLIGP